MSDRRGDSIPRPTRLAIAICCGLVSFGLALAFRLLLGQKSSDFDQLVVGMRRVLDGSTPYTLTPLPGLEWPVYYPMPAMLMALPFVRLSLPVAHALFSGVSGLACGWGISKDGDAKLFAFATWSFILTISLGQWGLLLMAGATIPALGWVSIGKPNIGLAVAAGFAPRWAHGRALFVNVAAVGLLIVASFVLRPTWLTEWRMVLSTPTPHLVTPARILLGGGPLLLLGLLRWRLPEGRLLAVLACVPQTLSSYDGLILFLTVRTRREALVLVTGSMLITVYVAFVGPAPSYAETVHRFAPIRLLLLYLPALMIVLRRPNNGDVPQVFERLTGWLPSWLAGQRGCEPGSPA